MGGVGRTTGTGALARAALLLGSLVVVAGVGEVVTRLAWDPPASPRHRHEPRADLPRLTIRDLLQPGVRGVYNGVLYQNNSAGFRGAEVPPHPARDSFRIAVVGDSVTMGSGVRVEDAYPARLEEMLRPSVRGRRPEVLNLGLAGLNAGQVVDRLAAYAKLQPDLVVYGYTLNDLEGPDYEMRVERHPQRLPGAPGFWQSHLLAFLRPRIESLRDAIHPPPDSYVYELNENYFHNPPALAWLEGRFDELERQAHEMGVCVIVLIHPRLEMLNVLHPYRDLYSRVAELAAVRGFTVAEAFPAFEGEEATRFWVGPGDPHPNAEGHERLARVLRLALKELPDHCWEGSRWRHPDPGY